MTKATHKVHRFLDTYDRQFNALYKHITYYKGWKCGSNLYGFDNVQTVTSLTELGYEMLANYFYHYNYSCYEIRKTRWVVHVTRMGTKHSYTTSVTEGEGQIPHVGQIPRSSVPFSTGLACLFTGMSVLKWQSLLVASALGWHACVREGHGKCNSRHDEVTSTLIAAINGTISVPQDMCVCACAGQCYAACGFGNISTRDHFTPLCWSENAFWDPPVQDYSTCFYRWIFHFNPDKKFWNRLHNFWSNGFVTRSST